MPDIAASRFRRPGGLIVLVAVVVVGLLSSAGLFRWGWTDVEAKQRELVAARDDAPKAAAAKLDQWLYYHEPRLQHRLTTLRFSSTHPGLITHTVEHESAPAEIWGIDLSGSHPARLEREGLALTLVLSAPRMLGRGVLTGMNANRVPVYRADGEIPDPRVRGLDLCEHFFAEFAAALAKDIEGATLDFRFEDLREPPAAAEDRG